MNENMNMNEMENQVEETEKGFNWRKALVYGTAAVAAIGCIGAAIYKKAKKHKTETQEETCIDEPIECCVEDCEEVPEEEEE